MSTSVAPGGIAASLGLTVRHARCARSWWPGLSAWRASSRRRTRRCMPAPGSRRRLRIWSFTNCALRSRGSCSRCRPTAERPPSRKNCVSVRVALHTAHVCVDLSMALRGTPLLRPPMLCPPSLSRCYGPHACVRGYAAGLLKKTRKEARKAQGVCRRATREQYRTTLEERAAEEAGQVRCLGPIAVR